MNKIAILVLTFFLIVDIPVSSDDSVQATGYDLTSAGSSTTINSAIFQAFNPADPSGMGWFTPFVRISSPSPVIRGYNTDFRNLQFEENSSPQWTRSMSLSEVPQIFDGILYRELQLDINQNSTGSDKYLTMDKVELYESPFANLCGYPFDGSGGGHSGCTTDNTATMIWDMDALEDLFIVLDYTNNDGAGKRDLRLLVPDSVFSQDPDCAFQGTGCTVYITVYSKFGGDSDPGSANPVLQTAHINNDGYEEWGTKPETFLIYFPNIIK